MATESGSKRTKMIVLGSAIIVIGLVAAVALWIAGGARRSDAVANLARAPIGCDTTLDFSVPGDYLIFVESKGSFADVRGDCDSAGDFEVETSRSDLDITVLDPEGRQLELVERSDAATYATDDFVGRAVLAIEIEEAGDHVMRVEAGSDAEFAVAVGRDPNSGVALLRGAAVAVGLIAVVVGLLLALVAGRKRQPAGPGWTPAQPNGQWPAGQPPYQQPGQPPYQQPTQPPYGQPGMQPGQPPYVQPGAQPQGQQPYFAPSQTPQPDGNGPPLYGGAGQPGHSGQAIPPGAQPAQPVPQPPSTPGMPNAPQVAAASPFAPTVPTANPFAPPGGVRHNEPMLAPGTIPGQPVLPGAGDGERGWPGGTDDDAPTPPHGQPTPPHAEPPSDVDRWNTSRPTPPN